jgi:hypothetical protein
VSCGAGVRPARIGASFASDLVSEAGEPIVAQIRSPIRTAASI